MYIYIYICIYKPKKDLKANHSITELYWARLATKHARHDCFPKKKSVDYTGLFNLRHVFQGLPKVQSKTTDQPLTRPGPSCGAAIAL